MKKILLIILALLLVACAAPETSQGSQEEEVTTLPAPEETEVVEDEATEPEIAKPDGYYYQKDSTLFTTGENANPAMEALGEPLDVFKAPSCAFEGEDTVYKYDNIELYTYEKDGQPHISGIFLVNEEAQTPEGLHIGSTYDEMVSLYGDDYVEVVGSYTYLQGNTELIIVTSQEKVVSITYILKV